MLIYKATIEAYDTFPYKIVAIIYQAETQDDVATLWGIPADEFSDFTHQNYIEHDDKHIHFYDYTTPDNIYLERVQMKKACIPLIKHPGLFPTSTTIYDNLQKYLVDRNPLDVEYVKLLSIQIVPDKFHHLFNQQDKLLTMIADHDFDNSHELEDQRLLEQAEEILSITKPVEDKCFEDGQLGEKVTERIHEHLNDPAAKAKQKLQDLKDVLELLTDLADIVDKIDKINQKYNRH